MSARRMERTPTADDARTEEYDERGTGARAIPLSEGEGPPREKIVRKWLSMRRKGWRKDPHGNGFLCPHASCKTAGDIHTRAHHDRWHEDILDNFDTTDEMVEELRGQIADRDETISALSEEVDRLHLRVDSHAEILSQVAYRGVYAIVEQVLANGEKSGGE
jgi:hypothetical protein